MVVKIEPEHFNEENDPFRVRLKFSILDKIQMVLVAIFLVPVRSIAAFIFLAERGSRSGNGTSESTGVAGVKYRTDRYG